jgi:tRNA(Arg) A34 adenosine deaminase TadA
MRRAIARVCEHSAAATCPSDVHYQCTGLTAVCTHEPCAMCGMALVHARIANVVYVNKVRVAHATTHVAVVGNGRVRHTHATAHYQIVKSSFQCVSFVHVISRCTKWLIYLFLQIQFN